MSLNEVAPYLESIWPWSKCWTRDYGSRSPAWPQLGEGGAVVEGPGGGRGVAQSQRGGRQPALFTFLITGTRASHSQVSFQQTRLIGCDRASCHLAARR